ncbi:MAG: hypothetical protein K8T90_22635 [Planctomycetes bacterium]|nr:hypothetical protein [Planctomycetota bacterium]
MSSANVAVQRVLESSPVERMRILAAWISWWYDRSLPAIEPGLPPGGGVPDSLRVLYQLVPDLGDLCMQNRLLRRQDLSVEDGKLVFACENQGVYSWSTDVAEADSAVYGRWESSEPWQIDVPSLSQFLVQFFLFEAAIGARFSASAACLESPALAALVQGASKLPMPSWHWPAFPTSFYIRSGAIIVTSPNDNWWSVYVGGKSPEDVAFLKTHINSSWDYVGLDGEAG